MSILNLLQQAQGGEGLSQLAAQLGLDDAKADELTQMLAPAIGSAARKRAETGGLEQLLGTLRGEEQGAMFDDARSATSENGQAQGMQFLSALLGGENEAQGLANEAAQRSGVDAGTVQKMLPALAAMAQGGLQKQVPDNSIDSMLAAQNGTAKGGGLMNMLGGLLGGKKQQTGLDLSVLNNLLDANGIGSALDDVLGNLMR